MPFSWLSSRPFSSIMETETSSTEMAAGNPTDRVPQATFFSRETYLGARVNTLLFLSFASTTKKYSMEITLESMVATAAPATSISNTKMNTGSRIIFMTPPMVSPMPASLVFPTERTRCPSTRPATVGIPPMTNTQNR